MLSPLRCLPSPSLTPPRGRQDIRRQGFQKLETSDYRSCLFERKLQETLVGELGYETEKRRQPTKSYEVSYHFGQLKFNPAGELDGTQVSEDTTRGVGGGGVLIH